MYVLARAVTVIALVISGVAAAQPAARVYRVGYIQTATQQEQEPLTKGIDDALRKLGCVEGRNLVIERRFADGKPDRLPALAAMAREHADAVVVLPDPLTFTARTQVVALAAKYRLPAVYHAREIVEVGGLLSYGPGLAEQFRRAAVYVDRILKGAKPRDLAVEQATKFELVINMKTARTLGQMIPRSLLVRADVIE